MVRTFGKWFVLAGLFPLVPGVLAGMRSSFNVNGRRSPALAGHPPVSATAATAQPALAGHLPVSKRSDAYLPSPSLYRSARAYAAWAIIFLVVTIFVQVSLMYNAFHAVDLVQRAESGEGFSEAEFLSYEANFRAITYWHLLALVATATPFIMWMHRAAENAEELGRPEYSPKDAIIWWFVPLIMLVMPCRVMRDIWRESHLNQRQPYLLFIWWAAWLGSGFGYWLAVISRDQTPTLTQLYWANLMLMAGGGMAATTAILAIVVIQQITSAQEIKPEQATG